MHFNSLCGLSISNSDKACCIGLVGRSETCVRWIRPTIKCLFLVTRPTDIFTSQLFVVCLCMRMCGRARDHTHACTFLCFPKGEHILAALSVCLSFHILSNRHGLQQYTFNANSLHLEKKWNWLTLLKAWEKRIIFKA